MVPYVVGAVVAVTVMRVRKLCTLGCFCFRGELGVLNCDDICMCVVNKQFELLEFLIPCMFTFIVGFVCWCGVYSHVVVLGLSVKLMFTFTAGSVCSYAIVVGLSVRLSWYHMWWVQWLQ